MKKILLSITASLLVLGSAGYLFKGQLWDFASDKITRDMFVAADTDSFDPGLAVGEIFPAIKAIYRGREISSLKEFVHDKGMVFITNRSANW